VKKKINLNVFKGLTFLEVLIEIWAVFWRSLILCLCTMGVREVYARFYLFSGLAAPNKVYLYWACFAALSLIVFVAVALMFIRRGENRRANNRKEPGLLAQYPRMLCRVWIYQEVIMLLMMLVMIFEGIPGTSLDKFGRLISEVTVSGYFLAQLSFVVISRSFVIGAIAYAVFSALILYVYYSCFSRFADKKHPIVLPVAEETEETEAQEA